MVEYTKEVLSFLRSVFLVLIVTIFSIIAYLFTVNLDDFHFCLSMYALIFLVIFEFFMLFLIFKNLSKSKELT